ncbi:PAS domain S-box-containing protein/diguanylate cyclase (GGDEF)-like protein [Sphaerotilus hippei]|uniref:PAS domain S-box-containing protein/diguanylate cyclase (GGDEF)-like protein n=1 Tax=Sphaerotilus hippei TaxID=744406 RepID=A0A318H0D1_9BURK|nr:EAL domain-containing protein [Sphaerotilus hippei]PXW96181.1 PAS domain S-box-containing protein/diguanylate cyclase (GGDEF)-like protein [Sphaerotilus hippei]
MLTSDESIASLVRSKQYDSVMRSVPLATAAVVLNSLIVGGMLSGDLPDLWLLCWTVLTVTLGLWNLQQWSVWRRRKRPARVSSSRMHKLTVVGGVWGLLWSALPALLLAHDADGRHQGLLVATITVTLGVGSVCLGGAPRAAYAYVAAMSLGALTGYVASSGALQVLGPLQWLLYAGLIITAVRAVNLNVHARMNAEVRADHQNQLIGLLLRDFEEQGSDLLWEIDASGRLCHVSEQLAVSLGSKAELLNGRSLLAMLGELQTDLREADRESAHTLHQRLTEGQPFRDVMLPMKVGGQQRWWSVTAKPVVDERGTALGWRGVARDVTQARMADRRLAWLAHYDTLTGLTNRAHFRVLLEQALQNCRRLKTAGAVMCLDLDNFKGVNDTLGHPTGDALLIEVGRRLKEAVGKADVVARLGGDEFAVLLRTTGEEVEVSAVAQRILDALREPCMALGSTVPVRTSIGVARFPQDGTSVDEMMQHADLALYDAKANATGTMRYFVQRMGEQVRRRLVLERDLRDALELNQLSLHYQPKVDLATWRIIGFEALLRWQHPQHGNIPPSEFITVAEECGLILSMGAWALQHACAEAATWPEHLQVAVNISPLQVMTEDLPATVEGALRLSGLAPHRLELEITESVFINETRGTVNRLHALRKLGIQIALDDFGTGYSSLAYLRRFPFDTLKIDRAFVRELLISRDARAIVRNILALAKSLRMATVAEGVEEPAQVAVLSAEGCDIVQGYFVARPLPAHEVLPFVRQFRERSRPHMPTGFHLGSTEHATLAGATTLSSVTQPATLA